MNSRATKKIRELNRRYWEELISILREYDLTEEDIFEFEELFPPFYPPFPPYKSYVREIEHFTDNINRFNNEFQDRSNLMFMNMSEVTEKMSKIADKFFKIPLIGKLDLGKFLKISMRKFWELRIIWISLLLFFIVLAFIFPTRSTDNSFITSYIDNLYTILMAFTTIGFGDIHPDNAFSRFVSVFLGIIGVATIGLSVTIFWSAAVGASKEKSG